MTPRCPECGSEDVRLFTQSGETMCQACGLVVEESLFEQNPYIDEAKQRQASIPAFQKAGGMKVDGAILEHSLLLSTREQNLKKAKRKLNTISAELSLPEYVKKDALVIFKTAVDQGINVGRSNLSMLYGAVYASCLMHCIPKTPLEVIRYSEVSKKQMLRAYKLLKENLGIKVCLVDPADFVPRFGSRLKLKQSTITLAIEIVRKLKGKMVMSGKHPQTIVASALYLASKLNKDKRTQREVSNATGVIEVTIQRTIKLIVKVLEIKV